MLLSGLALGYLVTVTVARAMLLSGSGSGLAEPAAPRTSARPAAAALTVTV